MNVISRCVLYTVILLGLGLETSICAQPRSGFINSRFPVKITNDVVYTTTPDGTSRDTAAALLLDIYEPSGSSAPRLRPGFVAVHGGGLGRADKRDANMAELCRELAARGYVCTSINYRLRSDDLRFPGATPVARAIAAAVEDAGWAVMWLRDNADRYGVDSQRIAVGGSSSGAEIVLRLAYGGTHRRVPVAAVFSWVGGLNGHEDLIDGDEPALFIVHGADDNSVPVTEAFALARRARQVGVPHELWLCEGLGHNVPLDRRPGGVALYRHLAEFLHREMDLGRLGRQPQAGRRRQSVEASIRAVPCPR